MPVWYMKIEWHELLISDLLIFLIKVGNTIEIGRIAGARSCLNPVVPTQIWKKRESSAIYALDCTMGILQILVYFGDINEKLSPSLFAWRRFSCGLP